MYYKHLFTNDIILVRMYFLLNAICLLLLLTDYNTFRTRNKNIYIPRFLFRDNYAPEKLFVFKVYISISYRKGIRKLQKCYINIHLNIDLFTFNKYCICKLLYRTISHNQKTLYNKLIFGRKITNMLKSWGNLKLNKVLFRKSFRLFNNSEICYRKFL